jgi:hypothetical protein
LQAAIRIKAELRTWIEAESGKQADSEIDQTIREFLQPLFELNVVENYMKKLHDIGCDHVRDMMSMTAFDLRNLGMKKAEDRKMVLSRLAATLEVGTAPKYIKEVPLNALIEATRYQAKSGDKKGTYKEWRKLREFFVERIGIGVSGPALEKRMREIYSEIDTENNAGKIICVGKSVLSQGQKKDNRLPCNRSLVARQTFPVLGPCRQNILVKRR